jgi:hypothetical protein
MRSCKYISCLQDFVNVKKERAKESAKRREPNVNEGKFVLNIDFIIALKPDSRFGPLALRI